jgi:hypothetical protein
VNIPVPSYLSPSLYQESFFFLISSGFLFHFAFQQFE